MIVISRWFRFYTHDPGLTIFIIFLWFSNVKFFNTLNNPAVFSATRLCGGHGFSQRTEQANQSREHDFTVTRAREHDFTVTRAREHDFTVSWQGKTGQIGDGGDGGMREMLGQLTLVGRVYAVHGKGKEKPFLQRVLIFWSLKQASLDGVWSPM